MQQHGSKRTHPEELVEETISIISLRMDYFPETMPQALQQLNDNSKAYIARYALGRDYHKLMRKRLQQLANKIQLEINDFQSRVFVDSAPVMEKAIAEKAGVGWIGKHTNLINSQAGSWFFLGEIYTNLPLAKNDATKVENHCGTCQRCMDICPTKAIIAPYQLDARKCISYLTIEHKGSIPIEFRSAIGNRIYGCDDCQLVCPWNRFSQLSQEVDFQARHQLDQASLLELFIYTEQEFLQRFSGSSIRRIGYSSWLRNISIALGNSLAVHAKQTEVINALKHKLIDGDDVLAEHIHWALQQVG